MSLSNRTDNPAAVVQAKHPESLVAASGGVTAALLKKQSDRILIERSRSNAGLLLLLCHFHSNLRVAQAPHWRKHGKLSWLLSQQ